MLKKATTQQILETISEQYAIMINGFTTVTKTLVGIQAELVTLKEEKISSANRYFENLKMMNKVSDQLDQVALGLQAYGRATTVLTEVQKTKRKK